MVEYRGNNWIMSAMNTLIYWYWLIIWIWWNLFMVNDQHNRLLHLDWGVWEMHAWDWLHCNINKWVESPGYCWFQTSLPLCHLITACLFRVAALSSHAAFAFSSFHRATLKLKRTQLSAVYCCGQSSGLPINWLDAVYHLVFSLWQVVLAELYKYHHQSGNAASSKLVWKQHIGYEHYGLSINKTKLLLYLWILNLSKNLLIVIFKMLHLISFIFVQKCYFMLAISIQYNSLD